MTQPLPQTIISPNVPQNAEGEAQNQDVNISTANWREIVRSYQKPDPKKSIRQICNTFIPYIGLWVIMYFTAPISMGLTLGLAVLASLFLMRIFIIFHDCGHGSFFASKKANNVLGFICGLCTLTPYRHWRWQHAVHHGCSGNLDARGIGDVWTMTVAEYKASPWYIRLQYRFMRNPIVLFGLIPLGLFWVYQRFSYKKASKPDRHSVYWMNLAIFIYATVMISAFGFWHFFWIQLTVSFISSGVGVWLFYVQHQFEDTYWSSGGEWDYTLSAMQGSSFYKLPAVLNWFSGNIGYHHIHHLSSRIANYNLKACHESEPYFQQVPELNFRESLKSLKLRLWDEESKKLVGYAHLNKS
ncbi:MAG: fatty acid desaturase [Opitutaceae bacterium]